MNKLEKINGAVSRNSGMKWCLVHIGNDITYGLAFVAGELLRTKHKIMWIDGDDDIFIRENCQSRLIVFLPVYLSRRIDT